MKNISGDLAGELKRLLPEIYGILCSSNLTVHDAVRSVVLSGSRGPKGGCRPDSDVDLSLLVDTDTLRETSDPGGMLEEVIDVTLRALKGAHSKRRVIIAGQALSSKQ